MHPLVGDSGILNEFVPMSSIILYSKHAFSKVVHDRFLFLGLPFPPFPALAYLTSSWWYVVCPSFLNTWPYHLSRFYYEEGCHWFNVGFSQVCIFVNVFVLDCLAIRPVWPCWLTCMLHYIVKMMSGEKSVTKSQVGA